MRRGSASDQPELVEAQRPVCRGRGLLLSGLAVFPVDSQSSLANHVSHLANASFHLQMSSTQSPSCGAETNPSHHDLPRADS